jgi:hypothetical protein
MGDPAPSTEPEEVDVNERRFGMRFLTTYPVTRFEIERICSAYHMPYDFTLSIKIGRRTLTINDAPHIISRSSLVGEITHALAETPWLQRVA